MAGHRKVDFLAMRLIRRRHPRSTAGPPADPRPRPHGSGRLGPAGRTLVLSGLGLLAGLTVLLVGTTGLRSPSSTADRLAKDVFPAAAALDAAQTSGAHAQAAFLIAMESQGVARLSSLTEATAANETELSEWTAYLRNRPAQRGAAALEHAYVTARRRSQDLGTELVALTPSDAGFASTLAAEQAQSGKAQAALSSLQASIYHPMVQSGLASLRAGIAWTRRAVVASYVALAIVFTAIGSVLMGAARRDQRQMADEQEQLRAAAERSEFDAALQRGLDRQHTESGALDVVSRALSMVGGDTPVELLLADSSQAHFSQAVSTAPVGERVCTVSAPGECPAASSGQTCSFEDSTRLDACSFLGAGEDPEWAICVPVSLAGQTCGVIHARGQVRELPRPRLATDLEMIARKTGERIGGLRVLARTEAQAQIDPLSGLPNRRAMEDLARKSLTAETRYAVMFADLDHFKAINDEHGHDVGDRAVRLFSRVLADSIRPGDLVARHGGEEFVAVLPNCSVSDARLVAERIRANLAAALQEATLPRFTVTIGLAAGFPGQALVDVVSKADTAMLRAKEHGRDQVLAS